MQAGSTNPAASGEGHEKPLTTQATNLSDWYHEVLRRAELINDYDVGGCYILRPAAYTMWEQIQHFLDAEFKRLGVKNCYFPLFIAKKNLTKEEDHIAGFAPEVAWVTRAGQSDLAEHIAVRPTSETGMYPYVRDWIQSYRDLPLQLNQWANVVRWEFSKTTPFLRTREFLWQEGHSAFASRAEAVAEVHQILDLYARCYEELLCVPVFKGQKSENEKFAGADFTTSIEGFIPGNGRGIQAATSHHLGQNFSRMFEINFVSKDEKQELVHQNSWGFTTRSIGVMVLTHGDDRGLVIPPRIADVQAVIVPIIFKNSSEAVVAACQALLGRLRAAGIRAHFDDRESLSGPKKFFYWELRGVPVRIEIGPKDVANNACVFVRRDTGAKTMGVALDTAVDSLQAVFAQQHVDMLARAKARVMEKVVTVTEWPAFVPALNEKKLVLAAWCNTTECEKQVKKKSADEAKALEDSFGLTGAAKTFNIPKDQSLAGRELPAKCFHCGAPAVTWVFFGRSY